MKTHSRQLKAEELLDRAGIKPTSNRLIVIRALIDAKYPMSLIEMETEIETLDRSSILRVLNLLTENDVIHVFEDGRGVSKYEICHGESHCSIEDMHAHFYCEKCNRVYCFENISAPHINIPENFEIRSVNYMLKGVCPECSVKS